jgi:hypothetical protein
LYQWITLLVVLLDIKLIFCTEMGVNISRGLETIETGGKNMIVLSLREQFLSASAIPFLVYSVQRAEN